MDFEEMKKTLPSDETLERMEKNGETARIDKKIKILEEKLKELKEKMQQENEHIQESSIDNNANVDKNAERHH